MTRVTSLPALDGRFMYSRFDEATHSFVSTHISEPDGSNEVELMLPGPEGGGRWSNAGTEIAVMTILDDGRVGTAVIRPDGTIKQVLSIPDPTLNLVCTVWSPEDVRLACEGWDDGDPSRTGVYEVDAADGANLVRLTTPPTGMNDFPGDFSPDGTSFLFWRGRAEGNGQLMVLAVGSGVEPEALTDGRNEDEGRFAPDGTLIATSVGGQLVLLGLDGEVRSTIAEEGRFLFGPTWSPTGEWLAYSNTPIGAFSADVYIARLDGSEQYQITDTPANEIALDWSRH